MIPLQKVKDLIIKYDTLEKELSSGKIDPKLFANAVLFSQAAAATQWIATARIMTLNDPILMSYRRSAAACARVVR